jgi:hypothetical protein
MGQDNHHSFRPRSRSSARVQLEGGFGAFNTLPIHLFGFFHAAPGKRAIRRVNTVSMARSLSHA